MDTGGGGGVADVIRLPGGGTFIICNDRDALELLDERLGMDMRRWLEDRLSEDDGAEDYIADLEKEADGLRTRHKEVMAELRQHSEAIAALIREKEIDRKALSTEAGAIGCVTWREINR